MRTLHTTLTIACIALAGYRPAVAQSPDLASCKAAAPIVLPVASDPTASLTVWFKTGSMADPAGKEGLALLTASLLAEGGAGGRSYDQILTALDPIAASYGTRVDKEMITFNGRVHRDHLGTFLELFSAAFARPSFSADDFERLKKRQLSTLSKTLRFSSDEELGKAALQLAVFTGSGYSHPPLGTVQGVSAITLDDVRAFYRQHFNTANAVVAVGGCCTDEKTVARLTAALEGLGCTPPPAVPPARAATVEGRKLLLVAKPGADASISLGIPLSVKRGDPDFYPLWLAASWLGEHRNPISHLYQVIREKRGLNYGDYAYAEWFPQGGGRQFPPGNAPRNSQLFEIWIRTLPNSNAHFALRAAVRELETLVNQGMSEEDFRSTQAFLSKYSLHYAESVAARLAYRVDDSFYGIGGAGYLGGFREAIGALTRERVNAALKRHLPLDQLRIAIVTGKPDELKLALTTDAPSPITYESPKPQALLDEDKAISAYPLHIPAGNVEVIKVEEIFER